MRKQMINNETKNPSTCFMEWEASTGRFRWWNKETSSYVYVAAPFTFIVLDELSTVKGWSKSHNSMIWSNEIRHMWEPLNLQTSAGSIARGTYSEIRERVTGIRYCQSVYIAYKNHRQELVLGNFQLKGAALSAWLDFAAKRKLVGKTVSFVNPEKRQKNGSQYYVPVLCNREASQETLQLARGLYTTLQSYLAAYLERQAAA
jgi:hypothetical protein